MEIEIKKTVIKMNDSIIDNPLVSIVIPCYNHDQFVQESIQSIIDQDYKNIELIVIDDGSKDKSVEKIKELIPACEARFFRFEFRSRSNKGLCKTLNEGLDWCEGIYFSGLASDDLIKPHKISYQVEFLNKHPEYVGVFGATEIIYQDGKRESVIRNPKVYSFIDIFLHKHNLPALTQFFRLANVKNVNGFRQDYIIEDWMIFLDLTKNGELLYTDKEVLASYRRHEGNLSGQLDKMLEGRLQIIDTFKDHPLYKEAKARIFLMQACDLVELEKVKSISFVVKALSISFFVIFSKLFLIYLSKFFSSKKYF